MINFKEVLHIIIQFYIENRPWFDFISAVVAFLGFVTLICSAFKLITYVKGRKFILKRNEIKNDIESRKNIEKKLDKYISDEDKNGNKYICIRFVYYKNYPSNSSNDGFKHCLRIEYDNGCMLGGSWIDNTGIKFQECFWWDPSSVYIDRNGIFFIGGKNVVYENFKEYRNVCLIWHLPFKNIVQVDFKNYEDYEPVFYIKYKYDDYRKLYDNEIIFKEKTGERLIYIKALDRRYQLRKFNRLFYLAMRLKIYLVKKMRW